MSHGSDESEDYWPGYVDALTSMVQVLAFVMMLLAMAVFVLSQNVSKSAVEAIAKAANIEVPPDANVTQITEKVLEEIKKAQAAKADGEKDKKDNGETDKTVKATPVPTPDTTQTDSPTVANAPTVQRVEAKPHPPEKPIEPNPDSKRVVLHFASRSFKIDPADAAAVADLVTKNGLAESKSRLIIRAFASSAEGALSESRRVAYYRAMTIRQELTKQKIKAEDIKINVYDTQEKDQGMVADVFTEK